MCAFLNSCIKGVTSRSRRWLMLMFGAVRWPLGLNVCSFFFFFVAFKIFQVQLTVDSGFSPSSSSLSLNCGGIWEIMCFFNTIFFSYTKALLLAFSFFFVLLLLFQVTVKSSIICFVKNVILIYVLVVAVFFY